MRTLYGPTLRRLLGLLCAAALHGCREAPEATARADAPVSDERCLSCHQDQRGYGATAHHRSSSAASPQTVAGSFREGENVLRTSNPYLHYRMEARDSGLYQTAVAEVPGQPPERRGERFAVVIGSGRKGQSYLYWGTDGRLFQLPVSYWVDLKRWVNSPGYPDGVANFERPVAPRCLECHAGRFASLPGPEGEFRYDTAGTVLGISCERCHGPGAEHVRRQGSLILRRLSSGIVNPADLPRQRQIEVCAQCHGGIGEPIAPAFTYRPGEPLAEHVRLAPPQPWETVDVHGNQVALLERSPCFQGSEMTCSTCHDVHREERSPAELSNRCLDCHKVQSCGLFPEHGASLTGRCVDCHMPEQTSNTIISTVEGRRTQPRVRNHWIKVYRESLRN